MRDMYPTWAFRAALALTLGLAVTACATPTGAPPTVAPESLASPEAVATQAELPTAEAAAPDALWTYEEAAHWGEISPEFEACGSGKAQSPIDLTNALAEDKANIEFHYQPSAVNILNNGHTVRVNYDSGSYIVLDGTRYDLDQFHFHTPSEHAVAGKLADAEVHLVHGNADGGAVAVGMLIQKGAENPAFTAILDNAPATAGPVQTIAAEVNAMDMLPVTQQTYRYDGSLTTPPCNEGVKWAVMATPIEMSEAQLAAFSAIMHANNRPLQDLLGRSLVEDSTP